MVATVTLNLSTINQMWVPTQDWYLEWARNINSGQVIYKDFFFPMPPLYVEIYRAFLLTADPLLTSRLVNLAIYTLMVIALFKVGRIYLGPIPSTAIAITLAAVLALEPTDTIAGYWEFAVMLSSWGIYWYLKRRSLSMLLFAGIFLSLSSLVKQNFLLVGAVIGLAEVWNLLSRRSKNSVERKNSIFFLIGLLGVYAIFTLELLVNGNLTYFINAMLSGGGKRLGLDNLFQNLLMPLSNNQSYILLGLLFLAGFIISRSTSTTRLLKLDVLLTALATTSSLFLFVYTSGVVAGITPLILASASFIFSTVTFNALLNRSRTNSLDVRGQGSWLLWTLLSIGVLLPSILVLGTWASSNQSTGPLKSIWNWVLDKEPLYGAVQFQLQSTIWSLTFLLVVLQILNYLRTTRVTSELLNLKTSIEPGNIFNLHVGRRQILVLVALGMSLLINGFNGSVTLVSNLTIAVLSIGWFFSSLKSRSRSAYLTPILGFVIASVALASPMMTVNTYEWFGWSEIKTANVKSELATFRNFEITDVENIFFMKVAQGISRAESKLPSLEGKSIAVFPNQPIFYNFSKLKPVDLRCPISWIDICPDRELNFDLQKIKAGTPSVVVFYKLPQNQMQELEAYYRNNQRSTLSWIQVSLENSGKYKRISTIPVPGSDGSEVVVFVKSQKPIISR